MPQPFPTFFPKPKPGTPPYMQPGYIPPGSGGVVPPKTNGGQYGGAPPPPNGWPANLPWQGQGAGQTGGYGGYPPAPTPPTASGGFGAPTPPQGQHGNWFDATSGVDGDWKDAWGNIIPHANYIPGGGGPGTPAEFGGPTPAVPGPVVPGLPTPPQQTPTTFYSPTTGSPYLQLPANWLSYLGEADRAGLNDRLIGAGFRSTGAFGLNGPSDYLKPAQFDENDLNALGGSESMRQWLRWFMGNLGYGQSYQLPGNYVPGSGLPQAPAWPQPPGVPVPIPDPYHP